MQGDMAPGVPTILILEDEPLTAALLARTVAECGFRIDGPHHRPQDARAALGHRVPEAALLDVSLGPQATSRAVADALAERGVPFAFVTGYGPETASVVSAHPQALVIPKPVDAATLGMLLGELLSRQARAVGGPG